MNSIVQLFAKRRGLPLGFLVLGYALLGTPRAVDAPFSFVQAFGVFFLTLFFVLSAQSWGEWIRKEALGLDSEPGSLSWFDLALGSGSFALLAGLVGHLGLLGSGLKIPAILFLLLGSWLPLRSTQKKFWVKGVVRPSRSADWLERTGFAVLLLLIGIRIIHGFQLSRHGDPFIYELMAPRFWFDSGRIFVPRFMPYVAQAGSWSLLNLWGVVLLAGAPGEGLVAIQHFGQWTHLFLGYIGTALVFVQVAQVLKLDSRGIWFWVLAALSVPELKIVASLAKCDWGSIFWMFAGLAPWLLDLGSRRTARIASGALLGLAFTAKLSTGYAIVPALGIVLVSFGFRPMIFLGIGFSIAAAPILLRNWVWTGNPVFPAFHRLFPMPLFGPSLRAAHEAIYSSETVRTWIEGRWSTLLIVLGLAPIYWISLVPPVFSRPLDRRRLAVWILPWLGIGLYLLHLGPHGLVRWIGPSWVALVLAGAISLEALMGFLPSWFSRSWVLGIVGASTVFLADLPLYTLAQIFGPKFQTGPKAVAIFFNHDGKAWLRKNLVPKSRILLLGDNEPYYLSQFEVHVFNESVDTDRAFKEAHDSDALEAGLRSQSFDAIVAFASAPEEAVLRLKELEKRGFLSSRIHEIWGQVWTVAPRKSEGGTPW